MKIRAVLPLLLLVLGGIFFLQAGITGLVIGETCCTGPNCIPENVCDYLSDKNTAQQEWISFGIVTVVIAGVSYLILHQKHH